MGGPRMGPPTPPPPGGPRPTRAPPPTPPSGPKKETPSPGLGGGGAGPPGGGAGAPPRARPPRPSRGTPRYSDRRPKDGASEPVLRVRRRRPSGGRHQIALAEPAPAEGREVVVLRFAVQDHVREDVADERRVLEAVSAPAEVGVEPRVLRNRAEHRVMVRRRVVES